MKGNQEGGNPPIETNAEKFHPQKIILFGSYAYGQPSQLSDVDLLVIMITQLRASQQANV